MEQVINSLRQRGYKITPQRRAVVEALCKGGKFCTAQQVLDYVKKVYPEIGIDTVYRNLNILAALRLVNHINVPGRDGNMYELAAGDDHHHHFVCLGCGTATCIEYCPVTEAGLRAACGEEFEVLGHTLEFYGFCKNCKQAADCLGVEIDETRRPRV